MAQVDVGFGAADECAASGVALDSDTVASGSGAFTFPFRRTVLHRELVRHRRCGFLAVAVGLRRLLLLNRTRFLLCHHLRFRRRGLGVLARLNDLRPVFRRGIRLTLYRRRGLVDSLGCLLPEVHELRLYEEFLLLAHDLRGGGFGKGRAVPGDASEKERHQNQRDDKGR